MSPHRRQTRASAISNVKTTVSKQCIPDPVPRTRSGQSRSNPPLPSKSCIPIPASPSKRKSSIVINTSPCRKNLLKPSSPKRGLPKITEKTSVKCPGNLKSSPVKSSPNRENVLKQKADKPAQVSVSLRVSPRKVSPRTPSTSDALNSLPKFQKSTRGSSLSKLPSFPSKETVKPLKSSSQNISSPSKQTPKSSPIPESRSSRRRLLPSPAQSPPSAKIRRLRGNVLSPVQIKVEVDSEEDSFLDQVKCEVKEEPEFHDVSEQFPVTEKSGAALPSDPELSGRFLRRKWFSLKARGGFTCLRSAILSPEEIAQEIMQHTNVDTSQDQDSNFFTTKLMVRLSSRLPPARARPSCEELVDLINSKQTGPKIEPQAEQKGEGTAIRVKLERRSFSDTMSHLKSKPVKATDKLACTSKPDPKPEIITEKGDGNLTKKQERDIALHQLKNLSAPEEKNSSASFKKAASFSPQELKDRFNRRRWFSLKSRGSFTSLRSAILSPEELTQEFMKRTKVDSQSCHILNPVTQHNSRVGSSRSHLSSEELIGIINSKQMRKNLESILDHKGGDSPVHMEVVDDLNRKKEQEVALQQLNALRFW